MADSDYAELSRWKRILLKGHVLLCLVCGPYHRHLMRFQDGIRRYREGEGSRSAPPPADLGLSGEQREAMRQAIKQSRPEQPD